MFAPKPSLQLPNASQALARRELMSLSTAMVFAKLPDNKIC